MYILRKIFLLIVICTVLLSFAACADNAESVHSSANVADQDAPKIPEPELTAQETFEKAVQTGMAAASYEATLDMQAIITIGIGPFSTSEDVTATTEIIYFKQPYKVKALISDTYSNTETEMYTVKNGDVFELYTKEGDDWDKQIYDTTPLLTGSDQFAVLETYAENIEVAEFEDEEVLNGETTIIITGELSGETVEQSASDILAMADFSFDGYDNIFKDLQNIPFTANFSKETGLITRIELDMGAAMNEAVENLISSDPSITQGVDIEVEEYISVLTFCNYDNAQEFDLPE